MRRTEQRDLPPRRKLYKIPNKGKICGVCAGLADYTGLEVWVVRLIVVTMLIFPFGIFNGPVFIGYWVLCLILDPKPGSEKYPHRRKKHHSRRSQGKDRPYQPSIKEVWRKTVPPEDLLDRASKTFSQIEIKLQKLERFVTSREFKLEQAFKGFDHTEK